MTSPILFLVLLFAPSAHGAGPSVSPAAAPPKIVFKKEEEHKFSGLRLKGMLKKPDLSYIYKRKGLKQEQIVNIPENFNQEIIEGADQF